MDLVAHIIKYNGQSTGRDKLCRLFQYASKYAGWYAGQLDKADVVNKLKNLENSLSSSRKVLRLGKSVDMVQGASKSLNVQDGVVRVCLVLSKLSQAVYLLLDHFVWAAKIKLTDGNAKELSKLAARFWLIGLVFNLIRNFYDIRKILVTNARSRRKMREHEEANGAISRYSQEEFVERQKTRSGLGAVLTNKPLVVDVIKNSADLLLPLNSLGLVDTPVQVQGVLGMISSTMGILSVWNPAFKLTP